MISLQRNLVNKLSISLTAVLMLILLATDIAVDHWISSEFERSIKSKISLLATLVEEDIEKVEFDFAGEFMPEFETSEEPEYFQLWHGVESFERSDSLEFVDHRHLPYLDIELDSTHIDEYDLPDGRQGMIIYQKFMPQVNSDEREEFFAHFMERGLTQKPVTIAYALSVESLNFILWFIDIAFVLVSIAVVVIIRVIVKKSVKSGISPIVEFNKQIKSMSLESNQTQFLLEDPVEELEMILNSLNAFLSENKALLLKEKRLTSDIAHEIKTPISELINLSEVALKFPEDKRLVADFKSEVLRISSRLDTIVSNILMLHKYNNKTLNNSDVFTLGEVLNRKVKDRPEIELNEFDGIEPIMGNIFAVEAILENLLNNAVTHRIQNTKVNVSLERVGIDYLFKISNLVFEPYTTFELVQMFEPLWQKDESRTSTENFGLGLAIVKVLCSAIDAKLSVVGDKNTITFSVLFRGD